MNLYHIKIQAANNDMLIENLKLLVAQLEGLQYAHGCMPGPLNQWPAIDRTTSTFLTNFCSLERVE